MSLDHYIVGVFEHIFADVLFVFLVELTLCDGFAQAVVLVGEIGLGQEARVDEPMVGEEEVVRFTCLRLSESGVGDEVYRLESAVLWEGFRNRSSANGCIEWFRDESCFDEHRYPKRRFL